MADERPRGTEDERIKIPLDPEVALRALLQVDPEADPDKQAAERARRDQQPPPASRGTG